MTAGAKPRGIRLRAGGRRRTPVAVAIALEIARVELQARQIDADIARALAGDGDDGTLRSHLAACEAMARRTQS